MRTEEIFRKTKVKILKFKKIESTQERAIKMVKKGTRPWTIIWAKEQTKGIGRKGDFWYSPKGGLYFSIILPKTKIEDVEILTNLTAFLVSKIIFQEFGEKPFIKFPNDIYLRGKKLAGILIQNIISGKEIKPIVGIGINTNIKSFPEDLKEKATSTFLEFKKKANNQKFLEKIIWEIKNSLKEISQ